MADCPRSSRSRVKTVPSLLYVSAAARTICKKQRPLRADPGFKRGRRREMPARWTVLASGSSGNASLLELEGAGLLVDVGLGPRRLERRLREVDFGWDGVRGVVLTHTHSDHWRQRSIKRLAELRVP